MKNLIKSIISYTTLVGVPIVCISAMSAAAYAVGHKDGKVEGLMTAQAVLDGYVKAQEDEE